MCLITLSTIKVLLRLAVHLAREQFSRVRKKEPDDGGGNKETVENADSTQKEESHEHSTLP